MSKQIRELKARKAALIDQASAINAAAAAANRDLDDTELSHFDALKAQIEGLNRQIEAAQFLIEQQAALGVEVPDGVIRV
ncbi:MAG TPA: phage major capsid protein, partial [Accumulibacter sp.]|nr:phage major capsid protein [Accumulibacter sp.]